MTTSATRPTPPDETNARPKPALSILCSGTTRDGNLCSNEAEEFGLCKMHLDALSARLLAGLLEGSCRGKTASGRVCSGDATDVCAVHSEGLAQRAMRSVIEASLRRRTRSRSHVATTPAAIRDAEEARTRLEAILARRRFVPAPDEAYTIPFEELRLEQRKAYGPSLVSGDEEVSFWYFERASDGTFVASYGVYGSMAGRDMPLASRSLFVEMMTLLKHLPGYTETCELSGGPIRQPLGKIAYKLLRGELAIDEVRFRRFAPEAAQRLKASRSREEIGSARRMLRLSPSEISQALLRHGASKDFAVKVLEDVWADHEPAEIKSLIHGVAEHVDTTAALGRLVAASPLWHYGRAFGRIAHEVSVTT